MTEWLSLHVPRSVQPGFQVLARRCCVADVRGGRVHHTAVLPREPLLLAHVLVVEQAAQVEQQLRAGSRLKIKQQASHMHN